MTSIIMKIIITLTIIAKSVTSYNFFFFSENNTIKNNNHENNNFMNNNLFTINKSFQ